MILQNLFQKFKKNIVEKESISSLSKICQNIRNTIDNSLPVFIFSVNNPETKLCIKNSQSYKTHNYYINTISTNRYDKVLFIINCDVLFNRSTKYSTDISIIVNGANVNLCENNKTENYSHAYRITACSFSVKSKKSKCKLQLMNNIPFASIMNKRNDLIKYIKNDGSESLIESSIDISNMIESDRIIFDKPKFDYCLTNKMPSESYYFIMECEDCELFQFYKHIEHIPKMEYQQILNCNINENVWS